MSALVDHRSLIRYLDMFFHTVDGNFHSTQKMKPMDPSDFPLTKGAGYYAEEEEFSHFDKDIKPPKKEVSVQPNDASALS